MSPRRRPRYHALAAQVRAQLRAHRRSLAADLRRAQAPRPQPHTGWEQQTESRLRAIEQQLANQNRLLLVAILTLAGDIALGLAR